MHILNSKIELKQIKSKIIEFSSLKFSQIAYELLVISPIINDKYYKKYGLKLK